MAIATAKRKVNRAGADSTFLNSIKKMDLKINVSKNIPPAEITLFTNQLSLMLDIGTPLNACLSSITAQITNPEFKKVLSEVTDKVEAGNLMSDALARYPHIFSDIYISLVKAGENTGQLREMLERVVEMNDKHKKFVATIKKSLTYPAILCFMCFAVVIFLLTYVFPRFSEVFKQIEDVLPASTKLLLVLSEALRAHWPAITIFLALAGWGIYAFIKTEQGRLTIDRLKISAPLISGIYMKVYLTMTMRTLGFLMGSNIPLMDALMIVRRGTSNLVFGRFIEKITENVEEGKGMSPAFAEASFIPETVKQMVKTGEESQNVPKVMLRLSDHYEVETDDQLKKFTSIVEPLLLVIMGLIVGVIVMSIILPIFKMSRMAH